MKKRMLALVFACFMLTLPLTACGGNASNSADADAAAQQEEAPQPSDLTGEWVQVNSNAEDSYQTATITDDTITVNWVMPDTTALYWAGSFEAPTTADEPYTWDSANDTEQTANGVFLIWYGMKKARAGVLVPRGMTRTASYAVSQRRGSAPSVRRSSGNSSISATTLTALQKRIL